MVARKGIKCKGVNEIGKEGVDDRCEFVRGSGNEQKAQYQDRNCL